MMPKPSRASDQLPRLPPALPSGARGQGAPPPPPASCPCAGTSLASLLLFLQRLDLGGDLHVVLHGRHPDLLALLQVSQLALLAVRPDHLGVLGQGVAVFLALVR